ncbi:hypothetical protein MMC16_000140 [Acarospora aff. strigata]|nr:hypothetical protein [Acarospora aff. strigata]
MNGDISKPMAKSPTLKFLVTGSTGGLGGGVLSYLASTIPKTDFAASSSRCNATERFRSQGLRFRHADYDDLGSLIKAFQGVEKLLFVSSSTFDNAKRTKQHLNVVVAAKVTGVRHVYYTSLAFGGYGDHSKTSVQAAHLATEKLLQDFGLSYTSIREGIYADAFPLFIDWFPSTTEVLLPGDGPVAFASRAELAEATAKLMISGTYDDQEIVLLTGPKAYTLTQIVDIINNTTGRNVTVTRVSGDEYVAAVTHGDLAGKGELFFRSRLSWFEGMEDGEGALVTGTMRDVLGREPRDGKEVIEGFLRADRDYEWHQNYIKVGK